MRKLLVLFVILGLAVPAGSADWPRLKFSFSLPAGDPTFNAFDPAPLEYYRQDFSAIHSGYPDGALVRSPTTLSYAHLAPQNGRSWGARLRIHGLPDKRLAPLRLDLSWVKEQRTLVQVWGSEFVAIGQYRESCLPHWEGWCVDGRGSSDTTDYREHELKLHVIRAGYSYDLLHSTKRLSLEPGIGLEWSLAKHRNATEGYRCASNGSCERLPRTERTTWEHANVQRGYASLSADVYPLGKRRFLGLGASTRYLLSSGDWSIHGGTLLGDYEIPIHSRRWSTSFHATLAF